MEGERIMDQAEQQYDTETFDEFDELNSDEQDKVISQTLGTTHKENKNGKQNI